MIFKRNKKKSQLGSGVTRPAQEGEQQKTINKRLQWFGMALAFAVLVGVVTEPPAKNTESVGYDIDATEIAIRDENAEFSFEAVDDKATKEAKDAAAAKVPDTYQVAKEVIQEQLAALDERISLLLDHKEGVKKDIADALLNSDSEQDSQEIVQRALLNHAEAIVKDEKEFSNVKPANSLVAWIMPAPSSIPTREFEPASDDDGADTAPRKVKKLQDQEQEVEFVNLDRLAELSRDGLEEVLSFGVLDDSDERSESTTILVLRSKIVGTQKESEKLQLSSFPSLKSAPLLLASTIAQKLGEEASASAEISVLQSAAVEMAALGLKSTLKYDGVRTSGARETARTNVPDVMKRFERGEPIVKRGAKLTEQARAEVKTYWIKLEGGEEPYVSAFSSIIANMIMIGLALACLTRAIPILASRDQSYSQALNVSLLLLVATLVIGRIVSIFEPWGFMAPLTAMAVLIAILLNARIAGLAAVLAATLVSAQHGYDWPLLAVSGAMALTGATGITKVRRRSDITGAVFKATLIGLSATIAISLAFDATFGEATRRLALVILNGVACAMIVPGLLSPLERLFGITTDIQLLEYSDLNNELLSRLAIEVPATYAHCLMLGQVGEAAAEAIGANGLLVRVCAYYHDIGKMVRPEYFSENQTGENVHDDLSPRMSSRAIAAHVSQGIELAKEFHLPKPLVGGIREHHGTCLIGFFHQQAVDKQKHGDVLEEDFRYPGPKPQSRETAILMICDAVESGIRSIKSPNEERVREFVDKIITGRAEDGQFDQCHLTLKELDTIKEVVTKRILTMMHTRISYPDRKQEQEANNVIAMSGGAD